MKRKFLASLLALCMVLTAVPDAWAVEGEGVEAVEAGQAEGSPVATENAARIVSGQEYPTLQEAVDAAEDGAVIEVLRDLEKSELSANNYLAFGEDQANKTITIDLKGCTLTADGGEAISISSSGLNLTLKNGEIVNHSSGEYSDGIYVYCDSKKPEVAQSNNVSLTLDGITLDSKTQSIAVNGTAKGNQLVLRDCEIKSGEIGLYYPPNGEVVIDGTVITAPTGIAIKGGDALIQGRTEIHATGQKVVPDKPYPGSGNLTLTGDAIYFEGGYSYPMNLKITDGSFTSEHAEAIHMNFEDTPPEVIRTIEITGGTFSSDPSEFVTGDYRAVEENGQFVVKSFAEVAVAKIGSNYYETLPLAVAEAKNGETITLLRSVEGDGFVATADNDFVLDLAGETYTINKTVGSAGTESNGIQLLKGATVEIKDGEIKFDNAKIGIKNYCDLTLENVQLVNTATANPVINNCGQLVINGKETVIEAPAYKWAITTGNYQKGDVITTEINGGEISSVACETPLWETGAAVDESVTTTINGGTIGEIGVYDWRADYGPDYADAPLLTNWKMIVNGGEIGALSFDENSLGKVTVNGGHFVEDPSAYVANGLAALKSHKTGYTYEVRKPATYTVTFTTDHGTAPEQVVETETFADTVVTLPAAPAVEGYTFLGWALEGKTYAAGEKYTVTKDVTFTAKWAENVDTPVVDEEVVILLSAPVVSEPVISGKPEDEAAAMKDMAEALQQPGAVAVEGLTDAAKDEIRDAAAAADKNEAFQKIVEDALAADPDADITTTIVLELYMDIQVKDAQVDGDKIAVELELTPMVKAKATIDPQHMTEANTVVLYTQEMNVTETVTITLPLPEIFGENPDHLYVKHETGKKTYYYDTTVEDGKVTFENPHGFSTFTLVTDDRYAEVQLGDLLREFVPSDVGMSLDMEDAYDAPRGEYFVGWKFDGISGVHDTLTDELLTKLAEKYSEEAVQAKPVFDEKSSGGSVDRGYAIRVEKTENGKVTAPSSATVGSTVTIKVKPDAGYQLDELVVTDKDGDELKLTDKGNGKFTFKMPKSKVTVEATFVEIDREPEAQELPFVDVADTAYYADAVRWAVAEGITGGTSAATFSPNAACTRAQAVTFLWRAAGSPVVNYAMGFTDVPADAYYAEAVRWAVSQGITTGATETTFAPDAPCTRAQIVTFIYRNVKAQGGGFTGSWMFPCPFTDVSADAYYFESVQWCVMKGITEGATETTFAPDATCTRAQIVTFLYRGAEK